MLGWELSPHLTGGMGLACSRLARSLTQQGTEVLFLLPHALGDEDAGAAEVRACDRSATPVDASLRPYQTRAEYDLQHAAQARGPSRRQDFKGGYGATLIDEVARYADVVTDLCLDEDFDVIHAHDWMTYAAGLRIKARTGKPLVCHVHSSERDRRPFDPDPEIERREQAGFDGADRIVCVSDFAQDALTYHYDVDPVRVRTVHNAVDADFGAAAQAGAQTARPPRVLFLGRLTAQKGPLYFLEAAAKVLARMPEVEFLVSGEGELLDACRARCRELGIAEQVHFTGFVQAADVPQMYAESDAYVMPSVSEPFGLTALEALACGVPVLLCRQSGAAEVLKSSVQFDHWDVDDLARKILAVLRFPSLREQLVIAGRAELRGLGWDASALRLQRVYDEVLA
ncbi:MAG: glycogen(starch) synthase [Chlamydiales bacterium]|jgi:glycogen(starch) synthase